MHNSRGLAPDLPHRRLASVLPRVVARVLGKLHRDVRILEAHAAGQPRLGFQPPGVVDRVVFFIVGLGQRGTAFAHIDMAGDVSTQAIRLATLRDVLERGLKQALPQTHVWCQTVPRLPGTSYLRCAAPVK